MFVLMNESVSINDERLAGFEVVYENMNIIEESMSNPTKMIQLSEAESEVIKGKIEDYISDSHDFIDKMRKVKNEHLNKARIASYISLGLSLLTMVAASFATMTGLVIAIIAIIGSLLALIFAYYKLHKYAKAIDELKDYKDKILKIKSKTENPKIKDKLNNLIKRIDTEIDVNKQN